MLINWYKLAADRIAQRGTYIRVLSVRGRHKCYVYIRYILCSRDDGEIFEAGKGRKATEQKESVSIIYLRSDSAKTRQLSRHLKMLADTFCYPLLGPLLGTHLIRM